MAVDTLEQVLAARRAAYADLATRIREGGKARAEAHEAQAQQARTNAVATRDAARTSHDKTIAAAETKAAADVAAAGAQAATTRQDADRSRATAEAQRTRSLADARAQGDSARTVATGTRDRARSDATAQVDAARAQATRTLDAARAAAASTAAAANAEAQRKRAAADATYAAAVAERARVAGEEARLAEQRASLAAMQLSTLASFSLMTWHGWSATRNNGALVAFTKVPGPWEAMSFVRPGSPDAATPLRYGEAVALVSSGTYLQAAPGGAVTWSATAIGAWETFTLVDPANGSSRGPVPGQARIGLRSAHGTYLQAHENGTFNTNPAWCLAWETFYLDRRTPEHWHLPQVTWPVW